LYLEGDVLATGQDTVAASMYMNPQWPRRASLLPLATRSMKGWLRLQPPRARLPYLWEGTCIPALEALGQGLIDVCLLVLLMLCVYFRPSEPHKLLVPDFTLPVAAAVATAYSIVLHPFERLKASKTFEFD